MLFREVSSEYISVTVTAFAADGAVTPTTGVKILSKAGVGAYTLDAPRVDGDSLIITSTTANAHVITATGLVNDGVTGGAKTTLTFAAFSGASIHLVAYANKWQVVAKNLVTIT